VAILFGSVLGLSFGEHVPLLTSEMALVGLEAALVVFQRNSAEGPARKWLREVTRRNESQLFKKKICQCLSCCQH